MDSPVLEEVFKSDYQTDSWKGVLKQIFPDINFYAVAITEELTESQAEDAKEIIKYGDVKLADGKELVFYEVELQDGKSVTRNRVGLRNLLHNYVISGLVDGVIATYYNKKTNDWRLSFISKNAYWDEEGKIVKKETAPKRYTFVLGKNESIKTALQRIQPLINTPKQIKSLKIDDLLRAFSVQKISKEFFNDYKSNYQAFSEFLATRAFRSLFIPDPEGLSEEQQKKETERNISNFSKKLMGRIVFLYFLQKKGWLGVPSDETWGNGERDFVSQLFKSTKDKNGFYEQTLIVLFFDTLNKKREGDIFELTGTKVPFLNGGLFDRINNEPTAIQFDPQLFENLFAFFDNYNFTIDENSPDDLDIGIDPEMLGLIFENLLEENRNKTGAFYTPKEVVHYMCKESLSLYLQKKFGSKLNSDELKQLDSFVKQTDNITPGIIKTYADDIQNFLDTLKVCDPAIGSGAFPLGILFEILRIRKEIFPHLKKQKNFNYRQEKLNIMRTNIYGVDIDGGAVDIARLRFWLSLIVDEEEPSPLPNLDYKIMQGDSMMESFEDIDLSKVKTTQKNVKLYEPERDLFGNIKNAQLTINSIPFDTEALEEKVESFFKIEDADEKQKKHKEIDDEVLRHIEERCDEYRLILLDKLNKARVTYEEAKKNLKTETQLEDFEKRKEAKNYHLWQKKIDELDRINERLHHMISRAERSYFLWHLFFKDAFDNGGFDIVIGNPPYGVSFSEQLKNKFELDSKDSYGIFMAHALTQLLKVGGTCTFIVSDTWLTIKSHLPLRELVLQNRLHKIVRLPADTFGATVNTCIYIQSKIPSDTQFQLIAADLTQLSPQKHLPEFRDTLFNLEKYIGIYTPTFAVYQYNQQLVATNTNFPIFVASPKLFAIMNDTNCLTRIENENTSDEVKIRVMQINGKTIELIRLGAIAEVVGGIKTYDNEKFVKCIRERGNYRKITTEEIVDRELSDTEKKEGISIDNNNKAYFLPFDKSGEMINQEGFLINYFKPTEFYINWSKEAVSQYRKSNGLRNRHRYFQNGITYSVTGVYAPTFVLGSGYLFGQKGATIFCDKIEANILLGIFCSKLIKYILKNYVSHGVDTTDSLIAEILLINKDLSSLGTIVDLIIKKVKASSYYDYFQNEQKEADALVYEAYGLNKADINEVETWYARRYPKMAKYADIVSLDSEIEKIEEEITAETLYAKRVRALIQLGENKRTEFKSTLRYCLKQKSPQLYIEHSVLKTIAAFLNSEGGTLLVGVDDDGNVLGLDNDYTTFGKDKNFQDEWVKHFDNITGHAFSNAIMSNIKLEFAFIEEKAVAIIGVNESATHVFMKNKTENNKKQFYVRRSGSTVELDSEEIVTYVKQKWG